MSKLLALFLICALLAQLSFVESKTCKTRRESCNSDSECCANYVCSKATKKCYMLPPGEKRG
nr:venom polypeptide precursor [Doratifera vulnerans]